MVSSLAWMSCKPMNRLESRAGRNVACLSSLDVWASLPLAGAVSKACRPGKQGKAHGRRASAPGLQVRRCFPYQPRKLCGCQLPAASARVGLAQALAQPPHQPPIVPSFPPASHPSLSEGRPHRIHCTIHLPDTSSSPIPVSASARVFVVVH